MLDNEGTREVSVEQVVVERRQDQCSASTT